LLLGPDDAERLLLVQTLGDHLSVARLENVQRQGRPREQNGVQRGQREKAHAETTMLPGGCVANSFDCTPLLIGLRKFGGADSGLRIMGSFATFAARVFNRERKKFTRKVRT